MSPSQYHGKVRLRVCGLLISDQSILLVRLLSPVTGDFVWMPPGGGIEYGESLDACLRREFYEETGLEVAMGSLQFVNELIPPPFHAVELYYGVERTGGKLQVGEDPEHEDEGQLIKEVKWIPLERLSEYEVQPTKLIPHCTE